MKYQFISHDTIIRDDNACIPVAPGNTDYEEYLKWVNEGNSIPPYSSPKPSYQELRKIAYPPREDYLDAVVKGDDKQLADYINACKAVKLKYPKE